MELIFWGTRGSIAVPGAQTLRFGGNTTCLELSGAGGELMVLDAGTGMRPLGAAMAARGEARVINLLMTHIHWDHLMGFPFFGPLYNERARILVGGWPRGWEGVTHVFDSKLMDGYFPLKFSDIPARVERDRSLAPPRFRVGGVEITTTPLNHPQGSIGYCFRENGHKLVFITDNELTPGGVELPPRLVEFCAGADLLVHDAQYQPDEMDARAGWGHSDWRACVELAKAARVERLVLTHHDPSRDDERVEDLAGRAQRHAGGELLVEAAYEGMRLAV